VATTLPQKTREHALMALGRSIEGATPDESAFADLARRFTAYFEGKRVDFPDKLDFGAASPFRRRVWETARCIPYGETRSYLWVARQFRKPRAARAVGQALGANPLPIIIPCHRVMASDGGLGGFSGGLGVKSMLLRLEGVTGDRRTIRPRAPSSASGIQLRTGRSDHPRRS
jgi:O-6-methylguanine DNA methyltransferase